MIIRSTILLLLLAVCLSIARREHNEDPNKLAHEHDYYMQSIIPKSDESDYEQYAGGHNTEAIEASDEDMSRALIDDIAFDIPTVINSQSTKASTIRPLEYAIGRAKRQAEPFVDDDEADDATDDDQTDDQTDNPVEESSEDANEDQIDDDDQADEPKRRYKRGGRRGNNKKKKKEKKSSSEESSESEEDEEATTVASADNANNSTVKLRFKRSKSTSESSSSESNSKEINPDGKSKNSISSSESSESSNETLKALDKSNSESNSESKEIKKSQTDVKSSSSSESESKESKKKATSKSSSSSSESKSNEIKPDGKSKNTTSNSESSSEETTMDSKFSSNSISTSAEIEAFTSAESVDQVMDTVAKRLRQKRGALKLLIHKVRREAKRRLNERRKEKEREQQEAEAAAKNTTITSDQDADNDHDESNYNAGMQLRQKRGAFEKLAGSMRRGLQTMIKYKKRGGHRVRGEATPAVGQNRINLRRGYGEGNPNGHQESDNDNGVKARYKRDYGGLINADATKD